MGNVVVWFVWIVAAFSCLGSGAAVVSFSNPYYSALALIVNLASLAVLYLSCRPRSSPLRRCSSTPERSWSCSSS